MEEFREFRLDDGEIGPQCELRKLNTDSGDEQVPSQGLSPSLYLSIHLFWTLLWLCGSFLGFLGELNLEPVHSSNPDPCVPQKLTATLISPKLL